MMDEFGLEHLDDLAKHIRRPFRARRALRPINGCRTAPTTIR